MNTIELDNGLRVVTDHIDYVKSLSIGLFIKAGSAYEIEGNNGISHLAEHVLCHKFIDFATSKGLQCNAVTTKEYICFFVKSVYTDVIDMVNCFYQVFTNPFDTVRFEIDKKIVLREIDQFYIDPNSRMDEALLKTHLMGTSYAYPINGTRHVVENLKLDNIIRMYNSVFVPQNMVISIAGNNAETCKELLIPICSLWTGKSPESLGEVSFPIQKDTKHIVFQTNQTKIKICFNGINRRKEDKYVLMVANSILGGSSKSRMHTIIRAKQGFSYLAYSIPLFFSHGGLLYMNMDTYEENIQQVMDCLADIIEDLCVYGVNDDELLSAKKHCLSELILKHETSSAIMTKNGQMALLENKITNDSEIMDQIHGVTGDDVHRIYYETFTSGKTILIGTQHMYTMNNQFRL